MGDTDEFKRAVELVIENVSFDHCPTVQVFEASIRFAPANKMYCRSGKFVAVLSFLSLNISDENLRQ